MKVLEEDPIEQSKNKAKSQGISYSIINHAQGT